MAEILFKVKTNGPEVGHWKLGDIVVVRENGWTWGREETKAAWIAAGGTAETWPEYFFLLKLPNVTVTQIEYMLTEFPTATAEQGGRRLWAFKTNALNQNQLDKLIDKGEFTSGVDLTNNQAKSSIRNKQTGAAASW